MISAAWKSTVWSGVAVKTPIQIWGPGFDSGQSNRCRVYLAGHPPFRIGREIGTRGNVGTLNSNNLNDTPSLCLVVTISKCVIIHCSKSLLMYCRIKASINVLH